MSVHNPFNTGPILLKLKVKTSVSNYVLQMEKNRALAT